MSARDVAVALTDYFDGIEARTAVRLTQLCALRGIKATAVWGGVEKTVIWDGLQYVANGTPCGPSVHGVMAWIDKQAGKL